MQLHLDGYIRQHTCTFGRKDLRGSIEQNRCSSPFHRPLHSQQGHLATIHWRCAPGLIHSVETFPHLHRSLSHPRRPISLSFLLQVQLSLDSSTTTRFQFLFPQLCCDNEALLLPFRSDCFSSSTFPFSPRFFHCGYQRHLVNASFALAHRLIRLLAVSLLLR